MELVNVKEFFLLKSMLFLRDTREIWCVGVKKCGRDERIPRCTFQFDFPFSNRSHRMCHFKKKLPFEEWN